MIQVPVAKFKEVLLKDGLVSAKDFESFEADSKRMGQNLIDILLSRGIVSSEYLYEFLRQYFGVERAKLTASVIDPRVLRYISEDIVRQRRIILFREEPDGSIDAAMEDPGDIATLEFLRRKLGRDIKPFLATSDDIEHGLSLFGAQLAEDFKKLIEDNIRESLNSRARGIEERAVELPIVAVIDNVILYAMSLKASDIHLEIIEDSILLRYRVDGVLREIVRMPKDVASALTARLKLLGGLKIDEHMAPQDGRFRYKVGSDSVDIRIAIMPTFYGEKIVMRLLPASQKPLSLEELGMMPDSVKVVRENISKTYGMLLVTGPTGSGKTTTLYSLLNMMNRPEVNIVTIEDPIEYDMRYVNQTQINPQAGVNFANGLRAILRQDPNIILVGEIRDEETAEISVHSALTGHLVLSTLHTNDAPTAVPRLMDMKIEPFLVAAVLNAILAQRLVRKVCLDCINSYEPDASLEKIVREQLGELGIKTEFKMPKLLYHGRGCNVCHGSGFKGRIGIFELLNVTEAVRKVIVDSKFTLDALRDAARHEGMITMFEDGLRKVETGMTTIDEVLRVIRE